MRTEFIQLPSIEEQEEVLKKEVQREVPEDKLSTHYVSLEPLIVFLNGLGVDTSEITLDKTWQEVRIAAEPILNEATSAILSADPLEISPKAQKLYAYLAEEDTPEKSDLIITFGAKTRARVEKAVELYRKGLAAKLLFSGGCPIYAKTEPEAEAYKKIALELGVAESDIITETSSINLADNIKSSLNLLDERSVPYQKIIVVNSPYAQRRGYCYLAKFSPADTEIYRVDCETREGLRENDWFTNEEGIRYVLGEYYKLWFGLVTNTN